MMLPNSVPEPLVHPLVVSAPGKVILFGEHSVVYGKRSLAFSLSLRTQLTISASQGNVELHLPEIRVERSWKISALNSLYEKLKEFRKPCDTKPVPMSEEESNVLRAFIGISNKKELQKSELGLIAFFYLYTKILAHPIPFSIKVKSEMPVGAGLGSSAAYAVCLAAALTRISGQINYDNPSIDLSKISKKSLELISEWAFCCEKIVHGTPSGIDNAICTYGGCVSFKSGKIDLISPPPLTIMLVNTRVSRNTKTMVESVKEKYTRLPSLMEPLFTSMDNLAETSLSILSDMKNNSISNDIIKLKFSQLCELIDMSQCLLSAIGVSHSKLDTLIAIAKDCGFHAKLTGAGGGGFGIILIPSNTRQQDVKTCMNVLETNGFDTWITELGGCGLTYSTSYDKMHFQ